MKTVSSSMPAASMGSASPGKKIEVEVPRRWYGFVQRSAVYWSLCTLGGVSITFAPLALYWLGRADIADWRVAVCFGIIYLVPLFFVRLGMPVLNHAFTHREQTSDENG